VPRGFRVVYVIANANVSWILQFISSERRAIWYLWNWYSEQLCFWMHSLN